MREDEIHYSVRSFLKSRDWHLIAGQYPNGSDDELLALNIMDPELARDDSPDHRRHSMNKLVPDLVALKDATLLIVEMKPSYSKSDEEKLLEILGDRRTDLIRALRELFALLKINTSVEVSELLVVPCQGMTSGATRPTRIDFGYFDVRGIGDVAFTKPSSINTPELESLS
ncbi:MAG: hypothetical protein KKE79_03705 [Actinobacteria bacterium]|nr:hypothetical protein [Actinomycetota bacterium]